MRTPGRHITPSSWERGEKPARLADMTIRTTQQAGLAVLLSLVLAGCGQTLTGSTTSSGKDALYFVQSATGLPAMYLGEAYTAPITVAGGTGPYTLRLVSGSLPPGIALSNTQLSGTPTRSGTYKFTLEATDSTLSIKANEYTVNVQELPPTSLAPTLPATQVRGETRIPVVINAPRNVRAARLVWELPEGVQVTRAQIGDMGGLLFWKLDGRVLTLDLGFKTIPRSGARVALITLKPNRAVLLSGGRLGYEARDGNGKLLNQLALPTPPAAITAPIPSTTGTPPAGSPPPTSTSGTTDNGKPADTNPGGGNK